MFKGLFYTADHEVKEVKVMIRKRNKILEFTRFMPFFLFVALVLFSGVTAQASSISVGDQILNGGFGTDTTPSLAEWTVVGTANFRLSTDPIDTATGHAGFNGFFTSSFAVLGDVTGAITTGQSSTSPDHGTSSISQTFTLAATIGSDNIDYYDLQVGFLSAFDGYAGNPNANNHADFFMMLINTTAEFSQSSNSFRTTTDGLYENYTGTFTNLAPGDYTLLFQLNEADGNATNTAAGIDNVSVTGTAYFTPTPPDPPDPIQTPVPEPSTFLLLGAGLVGVGLARKGIKR